MRNIFTTLLGLLNVKHTHSYSSRFYNEHPHKYNLYGLSKILSDYNIENVGVKINNKEDEIFNLEAPFIVYLGTDFAIVYKITSVKVHYIWKEKKMELSVDNFCKLWNGVTLLVEINEKSAEPNYLEHRKQERLSLVQNILLTGAISILITLTFISNLTYNNIGSILLTVLNLTGLYIGYLLVLKQMNIQSNYADKICSLFSQKDCNNVLESNAAKIGGFIGWSEIGFGYFTANIIILLFLPNYITYLALINIAALPYTLWSVWYQKYKAGQWCPLCLIIQAILWSIFIVNLIFEFIKVPQFTVIDILLIASLYIIPVLTTNIIIPKLIKSNKQEQTTQELNSIKTSETVFSTLLKQQPHYDVDLNTSNILFGNPKSDILVTILTNPHCNPCAKMHVRVVNLLKQTNNLCIQYVFSSFRPELDSSNKFLTSVYFEKTERDKIFHLWFDKGKHDKENFFKIYHCDNDNKQVTLEFERHKEWKSKTGIVATPTILVNGYKLPDNYKIEDLKYITTIKS